ncbi:replication initiation protein [Corynebacterium anserum]|uniref:replication initiation protein n=1 Tax=Corynebacterium anserum TaxID=2684406 RepID=UPI0036F2FE2A
MKDASCAPSWIGLNPINGKAQLIWLIDPVYTDASGDSSNMRLLRATTNQLCELLDTDAHFPHGFSRSPFYTGDDPTAYHWHYQALRYLPASRIDSGGTAHERHHGCGTDPCTEAILYQRPGTDQCSEDPTGGSTSLLEDRQKAARGTWLISTDWKPNVSMVSKCSATHTGGATSRERKALATMDR